MPPPSRCIHHSFSDARGCVLQLELPRRIQKLYNSAHGWEYYPPDENYNDWHAALPCLNYGDGLLTCPFFTNTVRLDLVRPVQASAPNLLPPPEDTILRIKPKRGRKLSLKREPKV
jgi:hypothetical protein